MGRGQGNGRLGHLRLRTKNNSIQRIYRSTRGRSQVITASRPGRKPSVVERFCSGTESPPFIVRGGWAGPMTSSTDDAGLGIGWSRPHSLWLMHDICSNRTGAPDTDPHDLGRNWEKKAAIVLGWLRAVRWVMLWRCVHIHTQLHTRARTHTHTHTQTDPRFRARPHHVSPRQPHGPCHAGSCFARSPRATDGVSHCCGLRQPVATERFGSPKRAHPAPGGRKPPGSELLEYSSRLVATTLSARGRETKLERGKEKEGRFVACCRRNDPCPRLVGPDGPDGPRNNFWKKILREKRKAGISGLGPLRVPISKSHRAGGPRRPVVPEMGSLMMQCPWAADQRWAAAQGRRTLDRRARLGWLCREPCQV